MIWQIECHYITSDTNGHNNSSTSSWKRVLKWDNWVKRKCQVIYGFHHCLMTHRWKVVFLWSPVSSLTLTAKENLLLFDFAKKHLHLLFQKQTWGNKCSLIIIQVAWEAGSPPASGEGLPQKLPESEFSFFLAPIIQDGTRRNRLNSRTFV